MNRDEYTYHMPDKDEHDGADDQGFAARRSNKEKRWPV
jgi:hypothetical protein